MEDEDRTTQTERRIYTSFDVVCWGAIDKDRYNKPNEEIEERRKREDRLSGLGGICKETAPLL